MGLKGGRVFVVLLVLFSCPAIGASLDDPIAHWSFDDPENVTRDDSGNGHDLVIPGNWSSVPGPLGNAIHFEEYSPGSTNWGPRAEGPHTPTTGLNYPTDEGFSVSFWAELKHRATVLDYWQHVASRDTFGLRYRPSGWTVNGPQACFAARYSTAKDPEMACSEVSGSYVAGWVHLAGVYHPSGPEVKLYANGVLADTLRLPAPMRSQLPPNIFVSGSWHETRESTVDDVRIYNGALTEWQVAQLYLSARPMAKDTDGDGVRDPEDPDDDNDGVMDSMEDAVGTDPRDQGDAPSHQEQFTALAGVLKKTEGRIGKSLAARVDEAQADLARAIGRLGVLVDVVEAQKGKKISEEQADKLVRWAQDLIEGMQGPSRTEPGERAQVHSWFIDDAYRAGLSVHPHPRNPESLMLYELEIESLAPSSHYPAGIHFLSISVHSRNERVSPEREDVAISLRQGDSAGYKSVDDLFRRVERNVELAEGLTQRASIFTFDRGATILDSIAAAEAWFSSWRREEIRPRKWAPHGLGENLFIDIKNAQRAFAEPITGLRISFPLSKSASPAPLFVNVEFGQHRATARTKEYGLEILKDRETWYLTPSDAKGQHLSD